METKWIYYIIALVFLVLVIMWRTGLLDDVKGTVVRLVNLTVGIKPIVGTEATVSEVQEKAIKDLARTMEEMRDSPRENCFSHFELPLLGEEGAKITLNSRTRGEERFTELIVLGGAGGQQEVASLYKELKDIKLCVVAGEEIITQNFENFVISGANPVDPYFKSVGKIDIYTINDYNHLAVEELPKVSAEKDNLESSGWLFKGKDGNICFLPTVYGGSDAEGVNNDYFTDLFGEESVPDALAQGKVSWCSSSFQQPFIRYKWVEFAGDGEIIAPGYSLTIRSKCKTDEDCSTDSGNCNEELPEFREGQGCLIRASDLDGNKNDCASAQARTGSLLPRKEEGFLSVESSIMTPTIKGDIDARNLLRGIFLWDAGDYPLVCHSDGHWYECNELSEGKELELGNYLSSTYSDTPIKIKCSSEYVGEWDKKYFWETLEGLKGGDFYPACPPDWDCIDITRQECRNKGYSNLGCVGGEARFCCPPGEAEVLDREIPVTVGGE